MIQLNIVEMYDVYEW